MNYLPRIIIFILSAISLLAHADDMHPLSKECSKLSATIKKYDMHTDGHQCGKEIENFKRFRLKDLSQPIAADKYINQEGHEDYVSAYYLGQDVLDGVISYPDGDDDHFAFKTKNDYFNFGNGYDESDIKAINYPVNEKQPCKVGELKMANAKMKIKFVHDIKGESSWDGSWLLDYEVISVGEYSCRPENL